MVWNLEVDDRLDSILEPVALGSLGTTLVPVLHPSYQTVWLLRLDYTYEGCLDAIAETLTGVE